MAQEVAVGTKKEDEPPEVNTPADGEEISPDVNEPESVPEDNPAEPENPGGDTEEEKPDDTEKEPSGDINDEIIHPETDDMTQAE